MLRARLLTMLAFNLVIAAWVFHDARARGARKPAFAAVLALVWGPLGLGLWESDRPLQRGQSRRGPAAAIARGFLIGWAALLPSMLVLAMQVVEHRAAVPGSLGREIGIVPATLAVTSLFWAVPAVLALVLGRLGRTSAIAHSTTGAASASLPSWAAAALAGAAALACAWLIR